MQRRCRLRLTGQVYSEPTDAASTWLFDIAETNWSASIVEQCRFRMEQMPPIRSSAELCGTLTVDTANALGVTRRNYLSSPAARICRHRHSDTGSSRRTQCSSLLVPVASFALIGSVPANVRVSGGITQSEVWCQILADAWDQPLRVVPAETPPACLAAAT